MPPAGGNTRGVQTADITPAGTDERYRWVALANTTAAVFMSCRATSDMDLGLGRIAFPLGRVIL